MMEKHDDGFCCSDLVQLYRTIKHIWTKGGTRLFKGFVILTMIMYMVFCMYLLSILLKDDNGLVRGKEIRLTETKELFESKRDSLYNFVRNDRNPEERKSGPFLAATSREQTIFDVEIESNPPVDTKKRKIKIEALSSNDRVLVAVNGTVHLRRKRVEDKPDKHRGMHCIVLNEFTGTLMVHNVYDTYNVYDGGNLAQFLQSIQDGRIVILAVFDEASYNLKKREKDLIRMYGSRYIEHLKWRDSWVFAYKKGFYSLAENHHNKPNVEQHSKPSHIEFKLELQDEGNQKCVWDNVPNAPLRYSFCSQNEGYQSLCNCQKPFPLEYHTAPITRFNRTDSIPIAVIGSNRPLYLYRMLTGLLQTRGVRRDMVNVYIDGDHKVPAQLAELLGVSHRNNQHRCERNCAIHQNYKQSLTHIFKKYPKAQYVIIFEEDLDVSPDIMEYFSQTIPLLDSDKSLFCISAWNDQGYTHSSNDPSMLYRVETMPGLGWVLKREIYKKELEPNWFKVGVMGDWDMWLRRYMLKKRECVIPDISRSFHFGKEGVNMSPFFHDILFKQHALNNQTGIQFNISQLGRGTYETEVHRLIRSAQVIDHTKHPCNDTDFIPNTKGHVYVIYIVYNPVKHYDVTWNTITKCLHMWDLEDRGFHKKMFRFWFKKNMIFVVGSNSPYAIYKPNSVKPIYFIKQNS